MRNRFPLLILSISAGCMVGPNYHQPYVEIPQAYEYADKEAEPTLNLPWWAQFGDSVLVELIDEALANNRDVKLAAANVENAIGILIQTRAPLFPQVGYSGNFSRMHNSNSLGNIPTGANLSPVNPFSLWQGAINGSWEIDLWGRTRRQVEAARANVYASYEARQNIILSLVSTVANTYIKLRSLDEQLVISIDTMESYADSVKYFETQFKYGQSSQMSVAQAKTQYEIAASKVPQLKAQIVQTENALSILLGRNPGAIKRGKSIEELIPPEIPASLPSELLCQRPDIRQAEQNLIAANAQIGAAQALYFPSLSLTGYYGNASQKLHQLFTGPSHIWNYVGAVTGPIFTAGAISGQVMQAETNQEAVLENYLQTIQNAFSEVENALVSHSMLLEQLEAQKRLVEAAGDYERLATLQYKGGYAPYFAVIQAQEQYFPAELSWVQTRAQLLQSLVATYQAMGGGWVDVAEILTAGHSDIDKNLPPPKRTQLPDIPANLKKRKRIKLTLPPELPMQPSSKNVSDQIGDSDA